MALDFSSTKYTIPFGASVYQKLNPTFEKQSFEDLKAQDENLKPFAISDNAKEAQKGLQTIYFRDPITSQITQSALSEESLMRLKETFGSADFYQRKDNSLILNGEAEKFVSGWYGDIAYQRGYLSADKNKNGFMEKDELDKTRSGFDTHGWFEVSGNKVQAVNSFYLESYIPLNGISTAYGGKSMDFSKNQKTFYNQNKFAAVTLALELDKTIKNDKDLNGTVEYGEIFTRKEAIQAEQDSAKYVIEDSDGIFNPLSHINPFEIIFKDSENKALLDKLAKNGFDVSKLDKKELEKLKENFPQFFQNDEFQKEKAQEYYENLKENFTRKSLEFLGISKDEGEKIELSYEKLSSVIEEILKNFKDTNVSARTLQGLGLEFRV